jgi:RNA polymerase sigma-70 factor (sigma-E family)
MTADADGAATLDLAELFAAHYGELVRLAAFLLRNAAHAEDMVQEAFVALASAPRRLHDPDRALGYVRRCVVNECRSAHRHNAVALKHQPKLLMVGVVGSAEEGAFTAFDRDELVVALRGLAPRRREVVVLRHYCDMSERDVAELLGISLGAVKSLASRGIAELETLIGGRT